MTEEKKIKVSEINVNFNSLKNEDYFPNEYEKELLSANVILLPDMRPNYDNPVFPEQTKKLYDYFIDNSSEIFRPSICISDNQYYELQLHADFLIIATILVKFIVFPTLASLLAKYIYDSFKSKHNDLIVKTKFYVEKNGITKKIEYEGKAEDFEQVIKSSVENFFKDK